MRLRLQGRRRYPSIITQASCRILHDYSGSRIVLFVRFDSACLDCLIGLERALVISSRFASSQLPDNHPQYGMTSSTGRLEMLHIAYNDLTPPSKVFLSLTIS